MEWFQFRRCFLHDARLFSRSCNICDSMPPVRASRLISRTPSASELAALAAAEHSPRTRRRSGSLPLRPRPADSRGSRQEAKRIHDHATNYLAQLADYNVTPDAVSQLAGRRGNFGTAKNTPRGASADRKAATATLPQAMNDASQILRGRIDKLTTAFRLKNPNFLAG
jgi:hypothetical protein